MSEVSVLPFKSRRLHHVPDDDGMDTVPASLDQHVFGRSAEVLEADAVENLFEESDQYERQHNRDEEGLFPVNELTEDSAPKKHGPNHHESLQVLHGGASLSPPWSHLYPPIVSTDEVAPQAIPDEVSRLRPGSRLTFDSLQSADDSPFQNRRPSTLTSFRHRGSHSQPQERRLARMPIENRNLEAGTRLLGRYKGKTTVCLVDSGKEGTVVFRLEGKEKTYRSLSSAATEHEGPDQRLEVLERRREGGSQRRESHEVAAEEQQEGGQNHHAHDAAPSRLPSHPRP